MIQVHVYRMIDGLPEYLILKRSPDEDIYPNLWQVITGTVEAGERAYESAFREIAEETSLAAEKIIILPMIASFYSQRSDCIHQVPVFALEVPPDAPVALSDEHSTFLWGSFETAISMLPLPSHKQGTELLRQIIVEDTLGEFKQIIEGPGSD
ncbi:MAG: NUDIX pyrophosphatase [Ectothiorhodospiraceae bacterium]|nr:NUDIX pyrophosphatase [Ectothiorhodospiraceae bacterium]